MSNKSSQISIWLAFSMLLLSGGLVSHVMAIPVILGAAKRDAWISIIISAPLFLLWITLLFGVLKNIRNQRIADWIHREFGAFASWIFRISASVVLFVSGTYTLQDTSLWAVTTYIQQTPFYVIVGTGVLISTIAACKGLRTIALTASIILPAVLLLGYFVMSANVKYKDFNLLLPVLEHGWTPVLKGVFYALAALIDIWVLLLFQHKLRSNLRWWHLIALGVFLSLMALGPTIGAITEFGPDEAVKQQDSSFEQWKILKLGQLFQHVDFLSIYQWLCGSVTRVAITLYCIPELLNVRRPVKRKWTIIGLAIVMTIIACFPFADDQTLAYLTNIQFPLFFLFVMVLTLLLGLGVVISKHRKETDANEPSHHPNSE
ncbi:MAG: endospore germination permease [Candidatus Pristimantibacillus sp.]